MQKILFTLYLTLSLLALNVYAEKPTSYGPVTKGKGLWEIAIALRPDETVDPYQVAIALLKANQNSFSNRCNYNTLKINETLHLPPLDQIKAIPVEEATSEFKRQGTQWKNRKTDKITCSDLLDSPLAPVAEVKPETKPQEHPAPAAHPASTPAATPAPVATATLPAPPAAPAPTPAPQPVADVKPAEPPKPAAVPAEFTKLMGVMLGLFGVMLLIAFVYDRFIDTE